MKPQSIIRLVATGLAALLLIGCEGPRLTMLNAEITAFNRTAGTVSWSADVKNSSAGQGLFCRRTPAEGYVIMQAWFTQSTDVDNLPRIPAGGRIVVLEGETLPVGETRSGNGSNAGLSLEGFTHLIIEVYTRKADRPGSGPGDASVNDGCRRFYTNVALPLP